jgi:hypothetical protein
MPDRTRYTVFDPDKPHIVLFTGTLAAVAEAVAAQPESEPLRVYASSDGFPRSLRPEEYEQFERAVAEARAQAPPSAP